MALKHLLCRVIGHKWPLPPHSHRAIYCARCGKQDFRWNRNR